MSATNFKAPTASPVPVVADKFTAIKAKYATPPASAVTPKKKRYGHARPKAPLIPIDQPSRMYAGNVLAVAGFSAMTLNNRIKDGRFPKPHYDGRRRWWSSEEIRVALGL